MSQCVGIRLTVGPRLTLSQTIRLMRVLTLSPVQIEERLRELVQAGVVIDVDAASADHLPTAMVAARPFLQDADDDPMARVLSTQTLHAHLHEQLRASRLSAAVLAAAEVIVDSIDDDGFLNDDLATVARWSGRAQNCLEQALVAVQDLEPVGVGARNLRECLLLQLRALPPDRGARDRALKLIAERTWDEFIDLCRRETDTLRDVYAFIRTLNWHPGAAFAAPEVARQPDVIVRKQVGCWLVQRNLRAMPRVQVRDDVYERVSANLGASIKEAKRFARDLALRDDLVLEVARLIVEKQAAFLEHGAARLVPLSRRDIAAQLGVHETTVSRVVAERSAWTPRGLIGFDRFFTMGGVAMTNGTPMSPDAIKEQIRQIVAASRRPLSDAAIAKHLIALSIPLSRRCVNKYRHQMGLTLCKQTRHRATQTA